MSACADTVAVGNAVALMFKVQFSLGILGIPAVMAPVGAVPGALLIIGWGAYETPLPYRLSPAPNLTTPFQLEHLGCLYRRCLPQSPSRHARHPGHDVPRCWPDRTRNRRRPFLRWLRPRHWVWLHCWRNGAERCVASLQPCTVFTHLTGLTAAALSEHGACTVWFAFVFFVFCTATASFPRFSQVGFLCGSLFCSCTTLC